MLPEILQLPLSDPPPSGCQGRRGMKRASAHQRVRLLTWSVGILLVMLIGASCQAGLQGAPSPADLEVAGPTVASPPTATDAPSVAQTCHAHQGYVAQSDDCPESDSGSFSSVIIEGRITDEAGRPVPGAQVNVASLRESQVIREILIPITAAGVYDTRLLQPLEPDRFRLTVTAPGYMPSSKVVEADIGHTKLDFVLAPSS